MINKIFKILFFNGKSYFIFVIISVSLSLFSYLFSANIISSINSYMEEQIKPIVGGDVVLTSEKKQINPKNLKEYKKYFKIARNIELDTNIFDDNGNPHSFEVIYYDQNYPFYQDLNIQKINKKGSINVDKNTYDIFQNNIKIYGKNYKIKGIAKPDITSSIGFFDNDKKIYIPIRKRENSGIDPQKARVEFNYFFKLKDEKFSDKIVKLINDSKFKKFESRTLDEGDQNIKDITKRLYTFINFFNLIIFTITFFIVILSFEIFFKKIKYYIGILKIFGLTQGKLFNYIFSFILFIFLLSFFIALLGNILTINFLSNYYNFFFFDITNLINLVAITIILLVVGSLSPFYKIYKSQILQLLKDESSFANFTNKDYFIYMFLIFLAFGLISFISGIGLFYSFFYSLIFVISIALLYIFFYYILLFLYKIFKNKIKNFYIFDAIRSTIKPGNLSFFLIFSGIISFVAIFVFFVFSNSFLRYLQDLKETGNDRILLNAQDEDYSILKKYFKDKNIYEIIRMRIEKINGKSLKKFLNKEVVSNEFSREFSITTNNLDNEIIEGEKLSSGEVSVDQQFAGRLGLEIGDNIVFNSAGITRKLRVVNKREAVRSPATPFFFFQAKKEDFKNFPKTYFVAYDSSKKQKNFTQKLKKEIGPYLSFLKIGEIIDIIKSIAKEVLKVVYITLIYITLFSILSFIVCIMFLSTFKKEKIKILNILGGDNRELNKAINIEYTYLIGLSFIVSVIIGTIGLFITFEMIVFFGMNMYSYLKGIGVIFLIFLLFCICLFIINNLKRY